MDNTSSRQSEPACLATEFWPATISHNLPSNRNANLRVSSNDCAACFDRQINTIRSSAGSKRKLKEWMSYIQFTPSNIKNINYQPVICLLKETQRKTRALEVGQLSPTKFGQEYRMHSENWALSTREIVKSNLNFYM